MTGDRRSATEAARAYYRAIDGDDYDLLRSLLAEEFVHDRPDRTIEGCDRFVRFMREERPQTDTTHPLDGLYRPTDVEGSDEGGGETTVVARGRLLSADGDCIVRFADVFSVVEGRIERIETYTN